MKFVAKNSATRILDNQISVVDLFSDPTAKFDFVIVKLNGSHPTVINKISDRGYFILSGLGTIRVGSESFDVSTEDFVFVPKGIPHGLNGKMRYAVVTSPPFSPRDDVLVK